MKISKYYYSKRKRTFDLALAISLLTLISPIILILSVLMFLDKKNSVIFQQKRFGINKKIFTLYKFRTMRKGSALLQSKLEKLNEAPYPMFKIKNDPRFSRFGKYLSKYGIDELPQIINILKGEMSFVGPRPLPVIEAEKLNETWDFRYNVKPGLLSKWALSPKRHLSLKAWKKLETTGLKTGSISEDIIFLINYIKIIIINGLFFKR